MALLQLQDQFVAANGLRIRYLESGTGRPTLLLHALNPRSSADEWLKSMDAYAEAGRRVFALDMPGWGLSEQPKDGRYQFAMWIESLKGFCDALQLEQVDIVGRTLGGWLAVLYAHQYPLRVGRLVLFNNAGLNPRPPLNYSTLSTMPTLEVLRNSYEDDGLAERIYQRLHQPGKVEEVRVLLDYVLDPQVREEWSLRPRLPQMQTPMLFAMRDNTGEMATQYAIEGFNLAPRSSLFVTKGLGPDGSAEQELERAAITFLTAMDIAAGQ
jgi:pimeloyl-ACP methyl ester carboxylesterase